MGSRCSLNVTFMCASDSCSNEYLLATKEQTLDTSLQLFYQACVATFSHLFYYTTLLSESKRGWSTSSWLAKSYFCTSYYLHSNTEKVGFTFIWLYQRWVAWWANCQCVKLRLKRSGFESVRGFLYYGLYAWPFNLTLTLYTLEYKWVSAKCLGDLTKTLGD